MFSRSNMHRHRCQNASHFRTASFWTVAYLLLSFALPTKAAVVNEEAGPPPPTSFVFQFNSPPPPATFILPAPAPTPASFPPPVAQSPPPLVAASPPPVAVLPPPGPLPTPPSPALTANPPPLTIPPVPSLNFIPPVPPIGVRLPPVPASTPQPAPVVQQPPPLDSPPPSPGVAVDLQSNGSSHSGVSAGVIVAITAGGAVALAAVIGCCVWCCSGKKPTEDDNIRLQINEYMSSDPRFVQQQGYRQRQANGNQEGIHDVYARIRVNPRAGRAAPDWRPPVDDEQPPVPKRVSNAVTTDLTTLGRGQAAGAGKTHDRRNDNSQAAQPNASKPVSSNTWDSYDRNLSTMKSSASKQIRLPPRGAGTFGKRVPHRYETDSPTTSDDQGPTQHRHEFASDVEVNEAAAGLPEDDFRQQLASIELSTLNLPKINTKVPSGPKTPDVQAQMLESLYVKWQDINLGGVLGEGRLGKVYKGMWQGTRVAVKMLVSPAAGQVLRQHGVTMCQLLHPSIARVHGLVDDGPYQALVMQYYRRGNLARAMSTDWFQNLSLVHRLKLANQVAVGMQYLHSRKPHPIIHGDLKTTNILLENDGEHAVIADYGLADWLGNNTATVPAGVHTTSIKPPEILQNPDTPRTPATDTYAFGIVLLELMSGKPAFRGMPNQDIISMVCSGRRPPIPEFVPQIISDIITDCWAEDPLQRPPFSDIAAGVQVAIQEASGGQFAETTTTMAWN